MRQYEKPLRGLFDWNEDFFLSSSMRMKNLKHAVNQDLFEEIEEHPLVMYYHFEEYSVFFQEITPFMFGFLSYLKEVPPLQALKSICEDFCIDEEAEVKELLHGTLQEFLERNILTRTPPN